MKQTIAIILFLGSALANQAQQGYAAKLSATAMELWKDSFALDGKPAKWTYDMGVVLKGIEGVWLATGDGRYFNYIQKQADYFVQEDGSIKTYKPDEYNIDHINNGKILLLLYRVTLKEKYLKAAKLLRNQLQTHPRTHEGGFWHKKIYPYQTWLDGLYMGQPFYAEYAQLAQEDTAFTDIANQFIWMEKNARDAKTGLLYHAYDESRQEAWADKTTGRSPLFWARAMGWYATALVDVLDYFPANHPKRKALIDILNRLTTAVEKQQDAQTGLWKDILNYNGADKAKNYFEASASAQFVYAIAKGVRKKYLPAAKLSIAQKGYAGIIKNCIQQQNGQWVLTGTVKVSGLGGKPYRDGSFAYYMSEPVITNDPKGVGAFIMAANEMEMLPTLSMGNGKQVLMDNYFNAETKTDAFGNKIIFHYKWEERDNGGFSMLGHIFNRYGASTQLLSEAPTAANLKNAAIYFLIDPDWPKENKTPQYIEAQHIDALYNYVKNGGVLVMLANDSNNVEFTRYNKLAAKFGMQWNENLRHDVKNDIFEQGVVDLTKVRTVFTTAQKGYIKQLCTQTIKAPAQALYSEHGEAIITMAKVGKGTVFAVGDPWFYNEYVDGRKLPLEYENYKAATDLVKWLLQQTKK